MNLTEKLKLWGTAHAEARAAERAAAQQRDAGGTQLDHDARRKRDQADRLHGEIYRELGRADRKETGNS